MVTRQAVIERLESVNDPHVPVSLRRMGMLGRVTVGDDGGVEVGLRVPCLGCPAAQGLSEQVRSSIGELPGVARVRVDVQWGGGWQRSDVDPAALPLLRRFGLQL